MANRLKSYVRRTLIAAARDYASAGRRTTESTRAACIDGMRGTDTGWWSDLIYTATMLEMGWRYRRDIMAALMEYQDATGEAFIYRPGTSDEAGATAILFATGGRNRPTWEDYAGDNPAKASRADCLLIGLRFAVEWYATEVARELGVEV